MLNKTKSKTAAILKYGLSAPLFAAMLILSSATIKERVEKSEQIAKLESHGLKEVISAAIPEVINKTLKSDDKLSSNTTSQKIIELKGPSATQTDTTEKIQDFATVDVLPEFPGGQEGFAKYISANFTYSPMARKQGVSGKVILSFIVEKDGDLSNIKVLRDMGVGTGAEAVRVLEDSPKWKPGKQNGKLVRVNYVLPISLKLEVENRKNGVIFHDDKATKYSADDSDVYITEVYKNSQTDPKITLQNPSALYMLNGKEVEKKVVNNLDPKSISSMNVLHDKSASDKYGYKGKDGVIEITTYPDVELVLTGKDLSEPLFRVGGFKGLVLIDGKQVDNSRGDALSKLKSKEIKSMNVIRGNNIIKKYGENGKDGIVEVYMDTPVQKGF